MCSSGSIEQEFKVLMADSKIGHKKRQITIFYKFIKIIGHRCHGQVMGGKVPEKNKRLSLTGGFQFMGSGEQILFDFLFSLQPPKPTEDGYYHHV